MSVNSSPQQVTKKENDHVIDARFQSYSRVYIADIQNAEIINNDDNNQQTVSKRGIIKIKNTLLSKVSVCGIIVNIFESAKYYRIKIDDSTGCINVTLWKSTIFNDQSMDHLASSKSFENSENRDYFSKLYGLLNAIQTRIKDESINNRIMYEPRQGDLILVRAQVKCFRQRIELNAVTCSRVQNSTNEMIQMVLPSILSNKVYSKEALTIQKFEDLKNVTKIEPQIKVKTVLENFNPKEKEAFISLVNKKLIQMSTNANITITNQQINSYSLFNFLKSNCPTEYKSISHKQVLDALKELESRGLAFSCEDEFNYIPMVE